MTEPNFLTTAQAASRLGIQPHRLCVLLRAGRVPSAVKFGRDWSIPPMALAALGNRPVGRPRKKKLV